MKKPVTKIGIEPFMETNIIESPEALHQWITSGSDNTFLIKIDSEFGEDYDILRGDWIVVDKSRTPQKNDVVVNFAPGGFVVIDYHLGLELKRLTPDSILTQQQSLLGVIVSVVRKTVKD